MPSPLNRPTYKSIDFASAISWTDDTRSHGSARNLDSEERECKRRRIEQNARNYLNGEQLFIASAALKGPFWGEWKNPWAVESNAVATKTKPAIAHKVKKSTPQQSKLRLRVTKAAAHQAKTSVPLCHAEQPSVPGPGRSALLNGGTNDEPTLGGDDDSELASAAKPSPNGKDWLRRRPRQKPPPCDPPEWPSVPDSVSKASEGDTPSRNKPRSRTRRALGLAEPPSSIVNTVQDSILGPLKEVVGAEQRERPQTAPEAAIYSHSVQIKQGQIGATETTKFSEVSLQEKATDLKTSFSDPIITPNGFQYRKKGGIKPLPSLVHAAKHDQYDPAVIGQESFRACTSTQVSKGSSNQHQQSNGANVSRIAERTAQENDCIEESSVVQVMLPPLRPLASHNDSLRPHSLHNLPDISTQIALAQAQESFDKAFLSPAAATLPSGFTPINRVRRRVSQAGLFMNVGIDKASAEGNCTLQLDCTPALEPIMLPTTPNLQNLANEISFSTMKKPELDRSIRKQKPRVSFNEFVDSNHPQEPVAQQEGPSSSKGAPLAQTSPPGSPAPPPPPPMPPNSTAIQSGTAQQLSSAFEEHQPSLLPTPATWAGEMSPDVELGLDLANDFLSTADVERDLGPRRNGSKVGGILKT